MRIEPTVVISETDMLPFLHDRRLRLSFNVERQAEKLGISISYTKT